MILNRIHHNDCIKMMSEMQENSVNLTLTDIPYDAVNRPSNGLRNLDKENADIKTFYLESFLKNVDYVTKDVIIIFCGKEQFSYIFSFFTSKKGTVRPIVWEKSNPSPMNGQYVYLSGVEMGVWFKKRGSKLFNAFCKNSVFKHPNGRSKLHPTEKNHNLIEELIKDNSNENSLVFDPCAGSGSHLIIAKKLNRQYLGCEIDKKYYSIAQNRLNNHLSK